jgi:hypothetical protein
MQNLRSILIFFPFIPGLAHAAELPISEVGTLLLLCLGVLGLVVRRQMTFKRRSRQAVRQEPVIQARGPQ